MPLLQILTDPKNFKFYAGGPGHSSTVNSFGQKSIPYGKDQFGGGWSKQPFVIKPISVPDSEVENTGGPDFLVRGGTLIPGRVADDVSRLTKLLLSKGTLGIQGVDFTVKQNLLSRTSVQTQTSPAFLNQGIYTPAQTIAEASLIATVGGLTGYHLPLFLEHGNYYDQIKIQRNVDTPIGDNRLYGLYETKIQNLKANFTGLKKFESSDPNVVMQYNGGPNAPLGVGKTRIFFADQRTGLNNPQYKTADFQTGGLKSVTTDLSGNLIQVGGLSFTTRVFNLERPTNGSSVTVNSNENVALAPKLPYLFTANQISNATPFQGNSSNTVTDFRKILIEDPVTGKEAEKTLISTDYTEYNLPKTFKVSRAGDINRPRNQYYSTRTGRTTSREYADLINLSEIQTGLSPNILDDLTPFFFTVLGYTGPGEQPGAKDKTVQFRAYLDSFNDGFSSEWSNFKFMGRGEDFYTYNGFKRTVNMSFTVYAHTFPEITAQYRKLNLLVSSLTPSYSDTGIMRGNFAKVTVGDYLQDVPGILTGMTVEIPQETPWELGRTATGGLRNDNTRLPFMVRVTGISFLPIYKSIPRYEGNFISNF